ncbi:MAG TPA: hypothetical protein VFN19_04100 [Candidatus Nanopelagicales bacterium]|nr:hypothetical protein [Candidatus Nanopelagicales bacterium]
MRDRDDRPVGSLAAGVPWTATVRVLAATFLLVRPDLAGRGSGLGEAATVRALLRALGAREAALGLGTLRAWRRHEGVRRWVAVQSVVNAADSAVFLLAVRRGDLPRAVGRGHAAFAFTGAVVEAMTWWQLHRAGSRPSTGPDRER